MLVSVAALVLLLTFAMPVYSRLSSVELVPRDEPYHLVQAITDHERGISLQFLNLTDEHCLYLIECPQSLRTHWSRLPYPDCSSNEQSPSIPHFKVQKRQKSGGMVLNEYASDQDVKEIKPTVRLLLPDHVREKSHLTTGCYTLAYPTNVTGRSMDVVIGYRESYTDCPKIADPCGDLRTAYMTLDLFYNSTFPISADTLDLPLSLLGSMDVPFYYVASLSPEVFLEGSVHVVLAMSKLLLEQQWDVLEKQLLNRTFTDSFRYDQMVQVQVRNMHRAYRLPGSETKTSPSVYWIVLGIVLALVLAAGLFLLFKLVKQHRRQKLLPKEEEEVVEDETMRLFS